jgi:hypothetical protein
LSGSQGETEVRLLIGTTIAFFSISSFCFADNLPKSRVVYDPSNASHPYNQIAIAFLKKTDQETAGFPAPPCGEGAGWGRCVTESFAIPKHSSVQVITYWWDYHGTSCAYKPAGAPSIIGVGSAVPFSGVQTVTPEDRKVSLIPKNWSHSDTRCIRTEVNVTK